MTVATNLKLVEKLCFACNDKGYFQARPTGELVLCDCVNLLCKSCDAQNAYKKARQIYSEEKNAVYPCKCATPVSNFQRIKKLYEKSNIPVRYRLASLDNLQVKQDKTASLFLAVEKIRLFFELPNLSYQGFYLQGKNTGSGKTHLACAILNELTLNRGIETRYCKVSKDFLEAIKATFNKKTYFSDVDQDSSKKIEEDLQKVPVLVLDDFGTQKNSDWVYEKIYDLIDSRYENNRLTIITSNLPMEAWKGVFENRIYSRLCEMTQELFFEAYDWREANKDIA